MVRLGLWPEAVNMRATSRVVALPAALSRAPLLMASPFTGSVIPR